MRWLVYLCAALCPAADLVIRDITIVDSQRRASVWISNGRVRSIASRVRAPKDAAVYDGRGKFLIPGLWDAHFHLIRQETQNDTRSKIIPALLAHGITSVRDMGSMPDAIAALKKDVSFTAPNLYISGMMIDGPPSKPGDVMTIAASPDEARAAVDRMAALGVDFIKVQQNLSAEAYNAVIERAKQKNLPVHGHTPDAVTVSDVARAGQKTVEHLTGVLAECAAKDLRKGVPSIDFGPLGPAGRETLNTFDEAKARALFERWKPVAMVPTLAWERSFIYSERLAKRRRPETLELMKDYYRTALKVIGMMHRAGIPIVAGTDGGDEFTTPGESLHEELQLLVEAGLTPRDALRAATTTPAKLFGAPADRADFVILSADPLTDIRNTRRIDAVVLRGRLLATTRSQ